MKGLRSMGWRLQRWHGVLLLAVLGGFGVTTHQLEQARQFRRIDEELRRRLPALVESQRPVPGQRGLREFNLLPRYAAWFEEDGADAFYYVVWLRHSDRPVSRSAAAPSGVPEPAPGDAPTRQRGMFRETFLFPGPGDCVLVGRSVASEAAGLRQFAWGLAGVGAAILLLGLTVGAWLVKRALRPIHDISVAAGRIATGDLQRRISTTDTDSELGELVAVLNNTFARLDAAFAQQARFTADAAHELRTPVTVLLTHAQNGLEAACECPEHREAFEAIHRAAQRMRRLIESLLELARWDAGQESLRRDAFDVDALVRDGVEMVAPLAGPRAITMRTDLAGGRCVGDADRLGQVVTNLLTNAVVHNKAGGEVTVRTRRDGGMMELSVEDNGPGIAAEDLPRIFDRFHRGDPARSRGGTGLGLAISKAIVEAHGGSLEAESGVGGGACFRVRLPVLPESTTLQPA